MASKFFGFENLHVLKGMCESFGRPPCFVIMLIGLTSPGIFTVYIIYLGLNKCTEREGSWQNVQQAVCY